MKRLGLLRLGLLAPIAFLVAACGGGDTGGDGGCPYQGGGSCRGDLEPGTFTTSSFQPPFSYTVPEGWNNGNDHPHWFTIGRTDEPFVDILVLGDVVPALSGPEHRVWPPNPHPDGGRTVDEVLAWLLAHPDIEITEPERVRLGALDGFRLDIGLSATSTATTHWCNLDTCMVVFKAADDGVILGGSDDLIRGYLVGTPDGDTVLVRAFVDEDDAPEAVEGLLGTVRPIIEGFEFGGGPDS